MKLKFLAITLSFAFCLISINLSAQVNVDVKTKTENEANRRANSNTDQAIHKAFDGVENGIKGLFGKKNKKKGKNTSEETTQEPTENTNGNPPDTENKPASENQVSNEETPNTEAPEEKAQLSWAKFDFIPGDKVIFEDGPAVDEENGEFPSRWDLYSGGVEIAEFGGETVIYFIQPSEIVPYLKDADKAYLPEVFTIEFDVFFEAEAYNQRYMVNFYDFKNQRAITDLTATAWIYAGEIDFMDSQGEYPGEDRTNRTKIAKWRHISIAFTKGKFKMYMDDTRLINIPHLEGRPIGLTLSTTSDANQRFIKNISIAEGGVKYYDRMLQDGKIVVNGIKFDVNKATLKPESMGPINKIYKLMNKNPDLNFKVEGHTDADGDEDVNQKLSEDRAAAVVTTLEGMGISSSRLTSGGWGESKPIDNNSTPEGKANNRRVEFIKM